MLFEKIRRTQKPVFIFLALTFGLGFVLLGVGSGTGGVNPLDMFNNDSGSNGSIGGLNDKVRKNPNDAAAWLQLAQAYAADQQPGPALGAYQAYIRLKPKDVSAITSAATLYENRARQTAAEGAVYQNQLSALQSQQSALGQSFLKASSHFSDPLLTAAEGPLQTKASDFQNRVRADLTQALSLWQKASTIDDTNPIYAKAVANDAIQTQDYKTAVAALKRYLKISPQAGDAKQIKSYIKQLEPLAGAVTPSQ